MILVSVITLLLKGHSSFSVFATIQTSTAHSADSAPSVSVAGGRDDRLISFMRNESTWGMSVLPAARSAAVSQCVRVGCSRPPPSSSHSPPDETTHTPDCAAARAHTHSSSRTHSAGGRSAKSGEEGSVENGRDR